MKIMKGLKQNKPKKSLVKLSIIQTDALNRMVSEVSKNQIALNRSRASIATFFIGAGVDVNKINGFKIVNGGVEIEYK